MTPQSQYKINIPFITRAIAEPNSHLKARNQSTWQTNLETKLLKLQFMKLPPSINLEWNLILQQFNIEQHTIPSKFKFPIAWIDANLKMGTQTLFIIRGKKWADHQKFSKTNRIHRNYIQEIINWIPEFDHDNISNPEFFNSSI